MENEIIEFEIGLGHDADESVAIIDDNNNNPNSKYQLDCRNYMRNTRQRSLDGDIHLLLDYLRQRHAENPSFFYAVDGDGNVFWADSKARTNYSYFGDTVVFDTAYRSNRYRLPFASFTGINHHGQPVLFGCAFLLNESESESESSFVWLFKTWVSAMSGRLPVSITTDHDTVIRSAVMQVLPETRHRFCKWHVFNKCREKLSHHYPTFEADFHKCVDLTGSVDEFEASWLSLVEKYRFRDHEFLYASRRQWVPVYMRDTFFAEMSITQRMDSYFDGYINASTTLNQFFKLYEKALESRNEKEVKADYDTINTLPLLRTPSPMEKQASEVYTRKIFMRFQDELVGTLTLMACKTAEDDETYQVSEFGEVNKSYRVNFNVLEMRATCSCCMFEFSGLLCRHVLAVFRVTNVLTLPSSYILKRWTINAKSSVVLKERVNDAFSSYLESHTVRYNTLRHEALKLVEEGAGSVDTYNVAMIALEEAASRISIEAKNEERVNGRNQEDSISNGTLTKRNIGNHHGNFDQNLSEDEMDMKIQQLNNELDVARKKCEVYRTNLVTVLREIEDHKQQLSLKVQIIRYSMKDCFPNMF